MQTINTTKEPWFPDIDRCISEGAIKSFGTQREAIEQAAKFGWGRKIIKVERRFERIYIVGVIDFQPDNENGIEFTSLRIPLLKYVTGEDGIKFQPVVKFRKRYVTK